MSYNIMKNITSVLCERFFDGIYVEYGHEVNKDEISGAGRCVTILTLWYVPYLIFY